MSAASNSGETGQTGCPDRLDRSSDRYTEPTGQTGLSNRSDWSDADWLMEGIEHYRSRMNDMCEAIEDTEDMDKLGLKFTSADPLEKVDIGDDSVPRPTFVNANLSTEYKADLIKLLKEYVDCFAWSYSEMPGLSRDLVEHRLSIKASFRPYKQPARRFNPIMYDKIKEEINHLLNAGFIRSCRYMEWISNIVPLEKKDSDKIRVCIDFRYLNKATPKDEYPMPIADILINEASGHRVISFLDGNACYSQIFMPKKIRLKRPLDVLPLLVCLSGLS